MNNPGLVSDTVLLDDTALVSEPQTDLLISDTALLVSGKQETPGVVNQEVIVDSDLFSLKGVTATGFNRRTTYLGSSFGDLSPDFVTLDDDSTPTIDVLLSRTDLNQLVIGHVLRTTNDGWQSVIIGGQTYNRVDATFSTASSRSLWEFSGVGDLFPVGQLTGVQWVI